MGWGLSQVRVAGASQEPRGHLYRMPPLPIR